MPQAKLTEEDIREIRKLKDKGWIQQDIADEFKIARNTVSYIVNHKRWGHIK